MTIPERVRPVSTSKVGDGPVLVMVVVAVKMGDHGGRKKATSAWEPRAALRADSAESRLAFLRAAMYRYMQIDKPANASLNIFTGHSTHLRVILLLNACSTAPSRVHECL